MLAGVIGHLLFQNWKDLINQHLAGAVLCHLRNLGNGLASDLCFAVTEEKLIQAHDVLINSLFTHIRRKLGSMLCDGEPEPP